MKLSAYFLLLAVVADQTVKAQDTVLPITIFDNLDHFIYREVASSCVITDVAVDIGIEHTWAGDVTIKVTHPDGTEVVMVDSKGYSADYKKENLIFYRKQSGGDSLDIVGGTVATQTIKVDGLVAFDGKDSQGRWMVTITDNGTQDQGTIDHVKLSVCDGDDDNIASVGTDSSSTTSDSISDFLFGGGSGASGMGFFSGFDTGLTDNDADTSPSTDGGSDTNSDFSFLSGAGSSTDTSLSTDGANSGESGSDLLPTGSNTDSDSSSLPGSASTSSDSTGGFDSGEANADLLPPGADDGQSSGEAGADLLPPGADSDTSDVTSDADVGLGGPDPLPPTSSPTIDVSAAARNTSRGGGGGDPHFKTWTGLKYDYHGECDLVLLNNPHFAGGLGLSLHIRTIRKGYFSYIERAALQIGDDTLEFVNRKQWSINGETPDNGVKVSLGGFRVFRFHKAVSVRLDNKAKAKIDFMDRKNGMPYIVVDGSSSDMFQGSLGMIGDWNSGMMIGRDGATLIEDPESFAFEWQVRDTEPMLFTSIRAPQYPAKCIPPKKMMGNRLGSSAMRKKAEKVCANWGEDKDDCIFDVMATRDIAAAESPMTME